jgi:hypothetical protein
MYLRRPLLFLGGREAASCVRVNKNREWKKKGGCVQNARGGDREREGGGEQARPLGSNGQKANKEEKSPGR